MAEIDKLKAVVKQVRCASCGAPVNLERDAQCPFCRAPIAILDADAVKRTLDELSAEERKRRTVDPQAAVDALLAGKRVERMAGGPAAARYDRVADSWNPGVVDLVAEALDAFMHLD